jgi:hypothetical protein
VERILLEKMIITQLIKKIMAYYETQSFTIVFTTKQAKGFIPRPSARRTNDLLKLNRDQLRGVIGLFTEHCYLKGHLSKLGLTDNPTCERCIEEDESATHIS